MRKILKLLLWIALIVAVISIGRACIYGGLNAITGSSSIFDPAEPDETHDWSWSFPEETAAPIEPLPTETAATQAPLDSLNETAGGYYGQLNSSERQIYNAVSDAVKANKNVCMISPDAYYSNEREIERAVSAFLMDHPECLDLNGAYTIFSNGKLELDRHDYWSYSSNPQRYTEQLMTEVSRIASMARQYPTDFDRAVFVHDYICENCRYDYERLAESEKTIHDPEVEFIYNAYGCLVQGSCVCQGYAEAYKLILDELGIECCFVKGTAEGERHGWNIVKLGRGYYHVDVTWDDEDDITFDGETYSGLCHHAYFGLTTEMISSDHKVDTELFGIPECTSTRYEYYSFKGYLPEPAGLQGILASIAKQREAGENPVVIRFADRAQFDEGVSEDTIHELSHEAGFRFIYIKNDDMLTLSLIEKKGS